MKKTFSCYLVLLGLILLQRVEAQAPKAERPPSTTAEQKQPVEDPLGRSTPHGTVVGLIMAAEQENLDRAAEYLDSRLKPPDRRELARKLWIVLDRKLFTSLDRLSNKPEGDLDDGLTNRDRSVSSKARPAMSRYFWTACSAVKAPHLVVLLQHVAGDPRLYDEIQPPWIEGMCRRWLRTIRWLSVPLYRWIAVLLVIPLIFGFAALSTRALTRLLRPLFRRLTRRGHDRKLARRGPLRLLVLALFFYGASFFGLSLATRHFWHRVARP